MGVAAGNDRHDRIAGGPLFFQAARRDFSSAVAMTSWPPYRRRPDGARRCAERELLAEDPRPFRTISKPDQIVNFLRSQARAKRNWLFSPSGDFSIFGGDSAIGLKADSSGKADCMTLVEERPKEETRARRVRERNRKRILDASIEIFARKGFDGASIAEIAERSGLPKANVYYYFESKQEIYSTIIGNLIAEWDAALAHIDMDRDPAEALAGYIRAKLDFSYRRTAQSKMFANEIVHGGRFLSRANRSHMRAITIEKGKIFEAWAKAGKMDRLDPTHLFILLWGSTQFYADFDSMVESMLNTRRLTREQFNIAADTIVHVVLKGCGVRGGAASSRRRADVDSHGSRARRSVRRA